jgi:UDP-2,3-diacylglucosamine hydrolase
MEGVHASSWQQAMKFYYVIRAMKAIFISDAHLKTRDAIGYKALVEFLDCLNRRGNDKGKRCPAGDVTTADNGCLVDVDDLYILGDFFDFWFYKEASIYPEYLKIIDSLLVLKERGVKIHLCEGNHDFFLADYFAGELNAEVIAEWASIYLDDRRVLISHGDTVDGRNRKYLLLRSFLRSRLFYKMQRALPTPFLWKAAQIISNLGKEPTAESANALLEKMRAFSVKKFRGGFDAVILGHCHKHLIEESIMNSQKKTFAVLGDWVRQYSYLCYENGNFTLATFRPPKENFYHV